MRCLKSDSLLLIIDVQERLLPAIQDGASLITRIQTLIRGAQILGLPMIVTEQYPKGLGCTVPEVRLALAGLEPFEKTSFSCCDQADFGSLLQREGKQTILLCGTESHVCVLQTALDLRALGFQVVVVVDCVGSRRIQDRDLAIERFRAEGILLSSCEAILFELCRVSGTEEFKAISRLVK